MISLLPHSAQRIIIPIFYVNKILTITNNIKWLATKMGCNWKKVIMVNSLYIIIYGYSCIVIVSAHTLIWLKHSHIHEIRFCVRVSITIMMIKKHLVEKSNRKIYCRLFKTNILINTKDCGSLFNWYINLC